MWGQGVRASLGGNGVGTGVNLNSPHWLGLLFIYGTFGVEEEDDEEEDEENDEDKDEDEDGEEDEDEEEEDEEQMTKENFSSSPFSEKWAFWSKKAKLKMIIYQKGEI